LKRSGTIFPSFFLTGILLFIFLNSCKKDPYAIGLDLLPPSDTLSLLVVDTATVVAYSVIQDSIRTDETTNILLGSLVDPVFGTTTASFYSQFRLSTEAPDFGTAPVLDSLVLLLKYDSIYGDTNSLQTVRVYELSQDLYYDSIYYSNHQALNYGTMVANYTFRPNLKDSVTVIGGKLSPHLRINLNKLTHYLGNKLLYAPEAVLATNTEFLEFMKGLYVETVSRTSGGALLFFKLDNVLTKMVVYFHNEEEDSLHFDFLINANSARFNSFDHNGYANADPNFRSQVVFHDTTLGKNTLYLQGLGGVRTRVRFPFLKDFNNLGHLAINNAILVFKNMETDTTYPPPVKLQLYNVDSLGRLGIIMDSDEGENYFDGNYDKSSRTYKFRITRQIQNILAGKIKNFDMYIMVNNPVSNELIPGRVILNGTQPLPPASYSDRIQLQITYTKLY
jgi:hypothetical protein